MSDERAVTMDELARQLGQHPSTIRGRVREYFEDDQLEPHVPEELSGEQADRFIAWHATRYGEAEG